MISFSFLKMELPESQFWAVVGWVKPVWPEQLSMIEKYSPDMSSIASSLPVTLQEAEWNLQHSLQLIWDSRLAQT
jgi:hypothetical protein